MVRWLSISVAFNFLAWPLAAQETDAARMFPFVLPWDDAEPGVANVSSWSKPVGERDRVSVGRDGHFHVGKDRIRFLGVNLCFAGNFPSKPDADKIAARMAKFGINAVRFHHMDAAPVPNGIRDGQRPGSGALHAEALDRLDYFIDRLAQHGLYTNLNLLVSRPFVKGDGLPVEIEQIDGKSQHVVGFFHEPLRRLQEDYARSLLNHRNSYRKKMPSEDPAIAFVEINNENGLLQGWLGGQVDKLPKIFLDDLQQQWNAWLKVRYQTTARLKTAWNVREEAPGAELLTNSDFSRGSERWSLEQHDQAQATLTIEKELPAEIRDRAARSAKISIEKPGSMGWHVQFAQAGLAVKKDRPCTLAFWARSDTPRSISVALSQAHAPWQSLGVGREIALTAEWRQFRHVISPDQSDDNARVLFTNLGGQTGDVWLAGISFRPGGIVGLAQEESLERQTVRICRHETFADFAKDVQHDWLTFLWETERKYWQTMHKFLKEQLKVRSIVVGTIVGCSTPHLMSQFDAIDTHAYWQHPEFPGRQWDPDNWIVHNRTMVNEPGGVLPRQALRRVRGMPHCITEYNHPAPNTFGSEGFLLLAAFAALQDWDAIFPFAYSHTAEWDSRHIASFFDISQHPTKMATLPAAAALFRRADVRPANQEIVARFTRDQEIAALRSAWAWELVHGGHAGLSEETSLVHRVALELDDSLAVKPVSERPPGPRFVSDTDEITWDLTDKNRGVVTVNAPLSKAVIGYGGGKRFDLNGVVTEPGDSLQDGWSAITLTVMDGKLPGPAKILVTVTGSAENTDMRWKTPAHESVGSKWGKAPSLVEGVPVKIALATAAPNDVAAWALDEHGRRGRRIEVTADGSHAVIAISPDHKSLWYEIEVK
jgi:hypothetical protein